MSTQSGSTTSSSTQNLPAWLTDSAQGYLGAAQQVAQQPFTPYTGQRVADLSPVQSSSIQGLSDLSGGTPYTQAAGDQLTNTLQGNYQNPYASAGAVGSGGQYQFDPVAGGTNPYQGQNPYLQGNIDQGMSDIVRNYTQATSPEITRIMNLSGNLGGSAHQNAMANAQHDLGNQLTNYENQQRMGAYNTSAGLADSGLNRNLQAGQFNASLGNTAFSDAAARGLNAGQFNANLGSSAYEAERNRQMGAISGATGLYGAQGNALTNALSAGDVERQQQQALLGSQYQDFTDWRNYPQQQLGIFGSALAPLFGGAPHDTTSTQGLPPTDRVGQGIGVMALANMLGRTGTASGSTK